MENNNPMSPKPEILRLHGICKSFGPQPVLDGVLFDLRPGEVHVLFGENGAGKSTLINIIAGLLQPDDGEYLFRGRRVGALTAQAARHLGIAAVFQEFSLVPTMSVLDNLLLGQEIQRYGVLHKRAMHARAKDVLLRLGFDLDLHAPVSSLSRAQKQMTEIAKALATSPQLLILDEPTASLTDAEAETLFETIARLRNAGVAIIYVSHRMAEIRRLADRITILRDGKVVSVVRPADTTDTQIIELMLGRPLDRLYPAIAHRPGDVRLSVQSLDLQAEGVRGASIDVRSGEIIGIAGLAGCGKSAFVRGVYGIEKKIGGTIAVGEKFVEPTPSEMLSHGVCYFPADRAGEGLAMQMAIEQNASMAALDTDEFSRRGMLRRSREKKAIRKILETLRLRPLEPRRPAGTLSGGNKQKVVLARALTRPIQVFLFDEPTVGIDVNAKFEVYDTIRRFVEAGGAVVIVSSDLTELLHLSHRLVIFREGRIVKTLTGDEIQEENALRHFFPTHAETPALRSEYA